MKQRSRRVLVGLVVLVAVAAAAFVVSRSWQDGEGDSAAALPTIPADAGNAPAAATSGAAAPTASDGDEDEAEDEAAEDPAAESPALDTARPSEADLVVTYSGFDVATGAVLVGAYVAGILETGPGSGLRVRDQHRVGLAALTVPVLVDSTSTAPGDSSGAGGRGRRRARTRSWCPGTRRCPRPR